jgi:hypothetical protein
MLQISQKPAYFLCEDLKKIRGVINLKFISPSSFSQYFGLLWWQKIQHRKIRFRKSIIWEYFIEGADYFYPSSVVFLE